MISARLAATRIAKGEPIAMRSFSAAELAAVGSPDIGPLCAMRAAGAAAATGAAVPERADEPALRDLISSGLLDPRSGVRRGVEHVDVRAHGDLAVILAVRRSPAFIGAVVCEGRIRGPIGLFGLAVSGVGIAGVVLEHVAPGGDHRYAIMSPRCAAVEIAALATNPGGTDPTGPRSMLIDVVHPSLDGPLLRSLRVEGRPRTEPGRERCPAGAWAGGGAPDVVDLIERLFVPPPGAGRPAEGSPCAVGAADVRPVAPGDAESPTEAS